MWLAAHPACGRGWTHPLSATCCTGAAAPIAVPHDGLLCCTCCWPCHALPAGTKVDPAGTCSYTYLNAAGQAQAGVSGAAAGAFMCGCTTAGTCWVPGSCPTGSTGISPTNACVAEKSGGRLECLSSCTGGWVSRDHQPMMICPAPAKPHAATRQCQCRLRGSDGLASRQHMLHPSARLGHKQRCDQSGRQVRRQPQHAPGLLWQ